MKRKVLTIIGAASLTAAMAMGACASESEAAAPAEAAAGETEDLEITAAENGATEKKSLDDLKWDDYALSFEGEVIDFPLAYTDLESVLADLGWTADDDMNDMTAELDPYQYTTLYFDKGDDKITVDVINFGVNSRPAGECVAGGLAIDSIWVKDTSLDVQLPGGIVRGTSTLDDIKSAYGPASDTYEGDLYTQLAYRTDSYEEITLKVYKDSGVLMDVDVRDFEKPEGFVEGEASTEVPAAVAAYEKPAALSDDPLQYQIRLENNVYSLPVPVSTLVADGFVIDEDNSEATVMGGSTGWVTLRLGGQQMQVLASNFEKDAVTIENCWVTDISAGKQDLDIDAELPGGITVGMSQADLESKLSELGVTAEKDESSSDFIYYSYANPKYGKEIQVIVYTGDNETYPKDGVLTVSVSNDELPQ